MPSASTVESASGFMGVVLAGGKSTRMGRDKALLELAGQTLLDRSINLLRKAGAAPIVVSGHRPSYDCVPDLWEGRGPLGGLASVLKARPLSPGRALIVLPVDAPGLRVSDIRRLMDCLTEDGAAACFEGHPLPLGFRTDKDTLWRLGAILRDTTQKASVHRFAATGSLTVLPAENVDLRNLNAPADLQAFSRM
ncbi:MAG: molybdenum cofactor guanylyltransferase [Algiphilus sp.]